jgi:hypothetical protein
MSFSSRRILSRVVIERSLRLLRARALSRIPAQLARHTDVSQAFQWVWPIPCAIYFYVHRRYPLGVARSRCSSSAPAAARVHI